MEDVAPARSSNLKTEAIKVLKSFKVFLTSSPKHLCSFSHVFIKHIFFQKKTKHANCFAHY